MSRCPDAGTAHQDAQLSRSGCVRQWWLVAGTLCAFLATSMGAGCHWAIPRVGPLYGVMPVPLDIAAFSYAPPSPVHTGENLTFTAQILQGDVSNAWVQAAIPGVGGMDVILRDDGLAPDVIAGDRVFSGARQWLANYGTGTAQVRLLASGMLDGQPASGAKDAADLQVLP